MNTPARDKLEQDYQETRAEIIRCLQENPGMGARRSHAYALECCIEFEAYVIERARQRALDEEERMV